MTNCNWSIAIAQRPFLALVLYLVTVVALAGCGPQSGRTGTPARPEQTQRTPDGNERPSNSSLDGREGRNLALDQFRPRAMLKVPAHELHRAKFPVVDVHNHLRYKLQNTAEQLDQLVAKMDRNHIAVAVSLDGRIGDELDEHLKFIWTKYKDRFVVYANIDWQGDGKADDPATWDCNRPDFARRVARQLAQAKEQGASGLKLFKRFGLGIRNADGSLVRIDDRRFDPIWEACGRLGLVVIMHTADPAAFFQPIDADNERWEELHRHPEWSFYGPQWPKRAELHAARNRVIARHRGTTFIAAHMANDAEDLAEVARWLDAYPNMYVEIASRISELGRQPYTARKFFLKYSDRILFGTDGPWPEERLSYYWRVLETYDEYFPYSEKPFPPQGLWRIYGLGLPDDVLRRVYHENAARLIPGVEERLETWAMRSGVQPPAVDGKDAARW